MNSEYKNNHRCEFNLRYGMLRSESGYYFGSYCTECGPYSRYSPYFDIKTIDNMSKEEFIEQPTSENKKLVWHHDDRFSNYNCFAYDAKEESKFTIFHLEHEPQKQYWLYVELDAVDDYKATRSYYYNTPDEAKAKAQTIADALELL